MMIIPLDMPIHSLPAALPSLADLSYHSTGLDGAASCCEVCAGRTWVVPLELRAFVGDCRRRSGEKTSLITYLCTDHETSGTV